MVALLALACTPVPSELSRPNRVVLGPAGQVYVADFHHDRVVEFDAEGRFVTAFGRQGIGRDELWRVTAMTLADDGSLMIANRRPESDARGSDLNSFELKQFADGREVRSIQLDGRVVSEDGWIDGIAPGPGGTWLIAESLEGALTLVDTEGRRVGRFGGIPREDAAPSSVRRYADTYWVIEQARHRITRMASGGAQEVVVLQDQGNGPIRFPTAVGVCRDEWLAVADLGNHRVQRYGLDGRWLGGFTPEPAGADRPVQLLDLALTADCSRLYLVDSKGDRVLVTDPDGRILDTLSTW